MINANALFIELPVLFEELALGSSFLFLSFHGLSSSPTLTLANSSQRRATVPCTCCVICEEEINLPLYGGSRLCLRHSPSGIFSQILKDGVGPMVTLR
ncbi:uncharacterized protein LOC143019957 isoform X2 [Oratosquilla oratoria]|uniref:uncharacterized protein LOC143019957 isoform X2 n=1 Tax=Oratosquilla oratoria TaxID=337810 RepID=UPI003F773793